MFKVGDKVVVVDAPAGFSIKNGEEHEVYKVDPVVGAGLGVYLKAFPDRWYYSNRFMLMEQPKPAPMKKGKRVVSLAAGELVRILPNKEDMKGFWAPKMDEFIGKVYAINRVHPSYYPEQQCKEVYFCKQDGLEYYFTSKLLQHLNTYDLLYQAAKELNIQHRGRMNKEALKAAIIAQAGVGAPPPIKAAVEAPKPLPEAPVKPAAPVKPVIPFEQEFREKVGKGKRSFDSGEVCCFGIEWGNGKREKHIMHWCHAPMNGYGGAGVPVKIVEDIAKLHICHSNPDTYAEFADWFINESVFAPTFVTKNWREASLILNLEHSLNRIVSTQVALRQMYEFQQKLNSWKWFVDKGYDKHISFILSNLFQLNEGMWGQCSLGNGHAIFCREHKMEDIVRFFHEPWYNDKGEVAAKAMRRAGYQVFKSFAPTGLSGDLQGISNKYFVQKVEGDGWNAKRYVDEDKLIECAEFVKGMYDKQ